MGNEGRSEEEAGIPRCGMWFTPALDQAVIWSETNRKIIMIELTVPCM